MMHFYLSLIFTILFHASISADPQIDSLIQNLEITPDSLMNQTIKKIYGHYAISKFDSALFFAQLGLEKAEEMDDQHFIVDMKSRIGTIYIEINDYTKALIYLNDALKIAEATDYYYGIAVTSNNIGIIHASNKDYALAIKYYELAIATDSVAGDHVVAVEPGYLFRTNKILHLPLVYSLEVLISTMMNKLINGFSILG